MKLMHKRANKLGRTPSPRTAAPQRKRCGNPGLRGEGADRVCRTSNYISPERAVSYNRLAWRALRGPGGDR